MQFCECSKPEKDGNGEQNSRFVDLDGRKAADVCGT